MSILIKDMDMPKQGEQLVLQINPNGKVTIDMDLKCKQVATAIEVPTHGRLIDEDDLSKNMMLLCADDLVWEVVESFYIHSAPTIIPADKEVE